MLALNVAGKVNAAHFLQWNSEVLIILQTVKSSPADCVYVKLDEPHPDYSSGQHNIS